MAQRILLNSFLFLGLCLSFVHSFAPLPQHIHRGEISTAPTPIRTVDSPLFALASPPAEEEKHKKKKDKDNTNDDDDWTPTRGGFLPNLTKRRQQQGVIQDVMTLEDYKTVVADERERIVVVRFYAPWCRACKKVEPLYKRLALEYSPSVKFVQVPLTKHNAFLHEGLGVPKLPYAHIYHPDAGLVEEMSMNAKVFDKFRDSLETYIDGGCDLPVEEDDASR